MNAATGSVLVMALLCGLAISDIGHAATKCVAADGRVSYTDGPCPKNSKDVRLKSEEADSGSKTVAGELQCAADWLKDKHEFENAIGRVDKTDQIIMNGEKLDMVAMYKKPANSMFNFQRCAKYGYVGVRNLRDFSINQWTANNLECKLTNPTFLVEVKKDFPGIVLTPSLRTECAAFFTSFPNPAVFEADLRAKSHPIP